MATTTRTEVSLHSTKQLTRKERKALYAPVKQTGGKKRRRKERGEVGPGPMGWDIPGGGKSVNLPQTPELRGPTVQVCGLYPFGVGSSLALIGAPLGPHLEGRGDVFGDPVAWFVGGLINNPSAFVAARPGTGKSTLIRHIAGFMPNKGVLPIVLSDWKPDYVDLVEALEGQVIRVGRSRGFVNPLDPGPLAHRLPDLPDVVRSKVTAQMRGRRMNVMEGLCGLALGRDLEAHERNILSAAMKLWDSTRPREVPVMADILALVQSRDTALRKFAQDRGDDDRYDERVQHLVDALMALGGESDTFGRVFAEHTSTELELDKAVVFDLSEFDGMDATLQAGVQLVCWSYGSTAVSSAAAMADAGLAPRRSYLLIMDELWRALRAAAFMVDRVDEITRLNRTLNLGQILCTHTMDDLKVHSEEATAKAWGFVGRSEMVYLGGLNPGEMGNLEEVFALSGKEKDLLTMWAQSGEPDPETGEGGIPLGRSKFLLKLGKRAGIPFSCELMPVELEGGIHDTNKAWADTIASMRRSSQTALALDDDTY